MVLKIRIARAGHGGRLAVTKSFTDERGKELPRFYFFVASLQTAHDERSWKILLLLMPCSSPRKPGSLPDFTYCIDDLLLNSAVLQSKTLKADYL